MRIRYRSRQGGQMDGDVGEITLDPPREGDDFATGDMIPPPELVAICESMGVPVPDYFPLLGGHEGAGPDADAQGRYRLDQVNDAIADMREVETSSASPSSINTAGVCRVRC